MLLDCPCPWHVSMSACPPPRVLICNHSHEITPAPLKIVLSRSPNLPKTFGTTITSQYNLHTYTLYCDLNIEALSEYSYKPKMEDVYCQSL